MRRALFFAFLLMCLSDIGAAQNGDAKLAGPPTDTPQKSTVKAPDYSQEAYVVEQLHTTYRFENDGTGRKEVIARVKVQSEAGVEQWGQLVMGYSSANERVEIPYVRVVKADGRVVTAQPDAVQDLTAPVQRDAPMYTDFRQKHVTVPGLRPGEVLEYDIVTIIHTALAPGQFWTSYDFDKSDIVLDEQLEINIPQGRTVKVKTKPGVDSKVTEADGRRIYRWTSTHLEREDQDKSKEKDEKQKKKKAEPEFPAVQLTTFTSWEEVGRWYHELEKERRQPTPEIRAKAKQLTDGKTTDLQKIEALYDYVATNFRYVSLSFGLGRYQPHAADDVLHNQYGDCKDKHTLLASLLEAEGFSVSSVLINSSRKLDPDVPSPSQFDHVISLVPLDKEEVWMDTTTEVAPFRLLSYNLRKKQALVIPEEGPAHLEETPADPPMPDTQFQSLDGTVDELGKLTAQVKYVARGDAELLMRIIFRRVPNAQWKQVVQTISTLSGLEGDVSNVKVGDPAATKEPFVIDFQLERANFLDWTKKKSDLDLPFSQFNLPEADEDADAGPEAEPIELGPPTDYDFRVTLAFPPRYKTQLPLAFSVKRDYAEYDASYKLEGNNFTSERKLVVRQRDLPQSRVSDYLAFRRAVLADLAQRLTVENTTGGSMTPPSGMSADDLNQAGWNAMQSGNYALAAELLKRAVDLDPKNKLAWNTLGSAYLAQRKTQEAIAAFNKQIEINPYDEYAYYNLGRAYLMQQKYDQAADAFHKQIEINPLDKFAHAGLGGLYAEQHKYDQAAAELEKAVSLTPNEPLLRVQLGDAYLNLGQDDKALATFDKAVDLAATPVVWNNIAYQLSLKKAHLDRAQQYAESAVAATAAASSNLALDQLNQRDLAIVPSLVAYWDTLGWVYFGEGDLDKAEKYVKAAWVLGQHGEVGDHLGQIYEKRSEKNKAIETYALALKGFRPAPETRGRLAALVGGDAKVDAVVARYQDELQQARTLKLGKVATTTASAEFFVLIAAGNSGPSVEGVKFVSGDEKLKVFAEALRTAKYQVIFPDDKPAKILRRGVLSCSTTTGECAFVLLLPEDVISVQ
jgi:tetratricopeptide (TPR) repeat protein/transglutaminase-like putative cysteine protease